MHLAKSRAATANPTPVAMKRLGGESQALVRPDGARGPGVASKGVVVEIRIICLTLGLLPSVLLSVLPSRHVPSLRSSLR